MAVINYFAGKQYIEPSVDVQIKNGIPIPNTAVGYGKTLMIDTGLNQGYGGGVGSIPVTVVPASVTGNVNLTGGFDFTTPKAFTVNGNGVDGVVTITLTANTTSLALLIAHINSKLIAANVYDVYAVASGNFVKLANKAGEGNLVLAEGTGNALAALGIAAGTTSSTTTSGTPRVYQDIVSSFKDSVSMQNYIVGGYFYDLADYLFNPFGKATGVPQLDVIRAAETSDATLVFTFGALPLVIKTKTEGLIANGDITTVPGKLLKGFAAKLISGTIDVAKFKLQFYQGTYAGVDSNGYQFSSLNYIQAANSPKLIIETPEFANVSTLIAWAQNNQFFSQYFVIDTVNTSSAAAPTSGDLTNYAGFNVFSGATENYTTNALSAVLSEIEGADYTFILSDKYESTAYSAQNIAIQNYIKNKKENKPHLFVGGYSTKDKRGNYTSNDGTTSVGIAVSFNDPYVMVVHDGDYSIDKANSNNKRPISSLYIAAYIVGFKAGLLPAQSIIYKSIPSIRPTDIINNENIDSLGNIGRNDMIQLGLIYRKVDSTVGTVFNSDVNSMQSPDNLVYQTSDISGNAVSYENISMQIKEELKRLIISKFKQKVIGKNSIEVTGSALTTEFNSFLTDQVTSKLIVSYDNPTVARSGIAYLFKCSYVEPITLKYVFFELEASI